MRKLRTLTGFAFGIGLLIALFTVPLTFGRQPRVLAQEGTRATPVPGSGGKVYDSYPHPDTRGALLYSIADQWNRTDLTFQFDNCPSLSDCDQSADAFRQAFADWAYYAPLTFTEVTSGADIEISWAGEEQDLGPDVDTLGFGYFPSDGGDIFINDAIYWEFDPSAEYYLYLTAAHEIGHALGLDHSSDPAALMYPYSTDQTTGIANDDIQGIQYLYGSSDGGVAPIADDNPGVVQPDDTGGDDSWYADGFIDDSIPYELWEIEANAGETLTITITRVDGDLLPYLGLLSDDETTILAEADALTDTQASITLTFPEAGSFLVMATRDGIEDGTTSGSYSLDIQAVSTGGDTTTGGDTATTDDYYGGVVQLANYSGSDLCELYISYSSDPEWGDDWLGGVSVADGEVIEGELDAADYDVLAVTCDGYEIEGYGLSVVSGSSIQVYGDVVTVYP